jgi:hypothetical protein
VGVNLLREGLCRTCLSGCPPCLSYCPLQAHVCRMALNRH